MTENSTITLKVKQVIGTGDPTDFVGLTPLIIDWGVPKNCAYGALTGNECDAPLGRLYVLVEPLDGFKVIGVCEAHHLELEGG